MVSSGGQSTEGSGFDCHSKNVDLFNLIVTQSGSELTFVKVVSPGGNASTFSSL